MTTMLKSKKVGDGDLVAYRGNKVIRCGGRLKLQGVWTGGGRRITRTLEGERIVTDLPSGVVTYGVVLIKAGTAPTEESA